MADSKAIAAVAAYFSDFRRIEASDGATAERSRYAALGNLLDAVGGTLRPRVSCVQGMANQGTGHPDFGLYTTWQTQPGGGHGQRHSQRRGAVAGAEGGGG